MSNIAPEWGEYHERCLVHPRRGGYKRKYQPEPDQTAYIVCYRSVWQTFIAHHLQKLVAEYGIDGVYLDGTSEPWGCANQKHGCGYVRTSSPHVKVSLYNRPEKGLIAVVANMGRDDCQAEATFNLETLQQGAELTVYDILAEKHVPFRARRLEVPLEAMAFAMLWFKPK